VPQARAVISHAVGLPRDVIITPDIAVVPLVKGLESKEVSSRACGGGAALGLPGQGGSVVSQGVDCAFPEVPAGDGNIVACNGARQFQVRIGEGAIGVVPGDHSIPDVRRKRGTPQERGTSGSEENATDASSGGVGGLDDRGVIRKKLCNARRSAL
jgi:hypothetical protein